MTNNYNPTTQESEIERMKQLMGYGLNESKSSSNGNNSSVAYHQVGPDGNTYGIIKECNKFYIKVAPKKDTEILAEDYDYIGGFMNKKEYEYPTYTIASKQFGLKMKSLNEAYASKEKKNTVVLDKPIEPAEWQVNETKEMRKEINRFNQLTNNVDYILSEGKERDGKALQLGSKDVDEEGGNAYQENPAPENKVNNMKENAPAPKDSDNTYSEKPMTPEEVNNVKETAKDHKKADKTYSKCVKLTNEQAERVLAWNPDKNYMDTQHGTEIGDGAPYDEKPEVTNEAVYNSEDMNQHTGDAEEYMEPFDDKAETVYEIISDNDSEMLVDNEDILADQGLDWETRDDMMDDFEPIVEPEINGLGGKGGFKPKRGPEPFPFRVNDRVKAEWDAEDNMMRPPMNEDKLNVFGEHPAWHKQPMTTPPNTEPSKFGREWDDDSVKGDEPYATKIGHGGDPYTEKVIDMLTDSVVDKLIASMTGEAGKKKD